MSEISGRADAGGLRLGVIVSRFNEFITEKLLAGAIETLEECGAGRDDVTVVWVPGSYEIPVALKKMAQSGYDAVVCLGVVIRGETAHFDFVAGEAARGIAGVAAENGLPVGFGVITAETTDQALDRAGGKKGNKGREAALAALEMADLLKKI